MTTYIENIVIGKIEAREEDLFAYSIDDWLHNEYAKTYFTNERFLPKILVEIGIYPSISEIRRNKPELMIKLDKKDFISKLKVAKKRYLWVAVGGTNNNEPYKYGIQQEG